MSCFTRRVCSAPHSNALDFLAPWTTTKPRLPHQHLSSTSFTHRSAAFSTSASAPAPPNSGPPRPTKSQPSQAGQSTKPSRPSRPPRRSNDRQTSTSHSSSNQSTPVKSTRRKPIETHRPPPSSFELLSAIRSYTPPQQRQTDPSTTSTTASAQPTARPITPLAAAQAKHNQAVMNLLSGSQSGLFDLSFTNGWLPIRHAGQVGRLKPADIARVLDAAGREVGREGLKAEWAEVRELVLWLCGESGMPGVDRWAMREVEKGVEGARRVVELWEALVRGDHWSLRVGINAPDAESKDPVALPIDLDAVNDSPRPLVSVKFYSYYIYANSIAHSALPPADQPSFRSLLPTLVHPRAPNLKPLFDSALPRLHPDQFANLDQAAAKARSWLRQVNLAQAWSRSPGGLLVIRRLNAALRRTQLAEGWELWEAVREAVESEEVGWLTDRWQASAGRKWVDDREEVEALAGPWGRTLEGEAETEQAALAEGEPAEAETPSAADLAATADERLPYSRPHFSPDDAHFTQALVAAFLAGFAKLRMLSQANAIWVWLHERGFVPGVAAWTGLLAGYASRGDVNAVEATWAQMAAAGVKPDGWAYLERARAYFEAKLPDEAMRVADALLADRHAVASFAGGIVSPLVYTTLIGGLLDNGRHDKARAVLDQMGPQLNIHAVNLLLRRATQGNKPNLPAIVEALRFVADKGIQPDVTTFTMVLQALLTMGQRDAPTKLISIMQSMGLKPSTTTYGAIIHSLARSGQPDELKAAVEILNEMERNGQHTNEIIYTSLIQGFLRAIARDPRAEDADGHHPYFAAALTLKRRMEGRGLALTRVGFNAVIAAGLSLRSEWGTALALEAFRDLRSLRSGAGAGREEIQRDGSTVGAADTWYVLLDGFAQQGDWSRAREALGEMERAGFEVRTGRLRKLVDTIMRGGWTR